MKKILALILVSVMAISFAACSKNAEEPENTTESTQAQTTEAQSTTASADETTAANKEATGVEIESDPEYVVFNASLDYQLEEDAWLGVIPTGTIYENEIDADEVDIAYVYCENLGMDGATSHRFAFEKEHFYGIEDGTYDLVLCSSDNGEIGKVLLQIGMEKNGEKITLDYENNK